MRETLILRTRHCLMPLVVLVAMGFMLSIAIPSHAKNSTYGQIKTALNDCETAALNLQLESQVIGVIVMDVKKGYKKLIANAKKANADGVVAQKKQAKRLKAQIKKVNKWIKQFKSKCGKAAKMVGSGVMVGE